MIKHYTERVLTFLLIAASVWFAWHGRWNQANYFLFAAAFVDFDDWSHADRPSKRKVEGCTREAGHEGPCNGYPSVGCPVVQVWTKSR